MPGSRILGGATLRGGIPRYKYLANRNELLVQAVAFGITMGEVSCPTKFFPEASSINFRRSLTYGFGVLGTAGKYLLHRAGVGHSPLFSAEGRKLAGR